MKGSGSEREMEGECERERVMKRRRLILHETIRVFSPLCLIIQTKCERHRVDLKMNPALKQLLKEHSAKMGV